MPSPFAHAGGNFNFQYTTASGGVASLVTTNAQRGMNAAGDAARHRRLVDPARRQRARRRSRRSTSRSTRRTTGGRPPKLTVNLGLRWEVQPGPTERFNRMSAWDFNATNAFGTLGAIAFPGVDGYSRNLWDTEYDNWGPRSAPPTQLNDRTVLRGGFGITYLPSNTGYFSGPTDYGSANFSGGVTQTAVRHQPARRAGDPLLGSGADRAGHRRRPDRAAGLRHRRSALRSALPERPVAAVERVHRARRCSTTGPRRSATRASVSRNLLNRSFPIQNLQSIAAGGPGAVARSSTSPATARSIPRRSWCPTRSSRRAARCCRLRARSARRRSRARTRCFPIRT